MSDTTFRQYQEQVDHWIHHVVKDTYFPPLSIMAQLTEEVGEVARVVNRTYGSQKAKESDLERDLGDELAGMLFAIACLANVTKIDLDSVLQRHLEKITARDKNRFDAA